MEAADYCTKIFHASEDVESLDADDAAAINTCQGIFKKSYIEAQLTYITANFMYLKFTILELEKNGSQLINSELLSSALVYEFKKNPVLTIMIVKNLYCQQLWLLNQGRIAM